MGYSDVARSAVALLVCLLGASVGLMQGYLGLPGIVAYLVVGALVFTLLFSQREALLRWFYGLPAGVITALIALTFIALAVIFFVVYPSAHAGKLGIASDSDDALNVAVNELLHGRFPYYARTYLGNQLTPMPGAVLIAFPFVLLGTSALQNIFWLAAFLAVFARYFKDRREAFLLLLLMLGLSPVIVYQVINGSDYFSNAIYVLLPLLWLIWSAGKNKSLNWLSLLAAAALGIALSSRANFLLILPLVFFALARILDWKTALQYTAVTIVAFTAITLPFYLYDPHNFSPLHTASKLGQFNRILPYAGTIIPLAGGLLACALGLWQQDEKIETLLRNCALTIAFPIVCGVILSSVTSHSLELSFTIFSGMFLFFAVPALGPRLLRRT